MAIRFQEPVQIPSEEDAVPSMSFPTNAVSPQDNRDSLMEADSEVAGITGGIQKGIKFEDTPDRPGLNFSEKPGIKFTEPDKSGVKFSEPEKSGVKFSEPERSGVKFSEPEKSGVKFSEPDRPDSPTGASGGAKRDSKLPGLHVTISTPGSDKPQSTGSIRRKYTINFDIPPVRPMPSKIPETYVFSAPIIYAYFLNRKSRRRYRKLKRRRQSDWT